MEFFNSFDFDNDVLFIFNFGVLYDVVFIGYKGISIMDFICFIIIDIRNIKIWNFNILNNCLVYYVFKYLLFKID